MFFLPLCLVFMQESISYYPFFENFTTIYTWVQKKKQVWFCFEACSLKQQDLNFTRWNVSGRFIFKLKTKGYCLHQRRFDKFLHLIFILGVFYVYTLILTLWVPTLFCHFCHQQKIGCNSADFGHKSMNYIPNER